MILDIPRFHCFVEKKALTNNNESGLVEAYAFSVTLIESRPLLFTVHTIDGAVYSRLPIWFIYHEKPDSKIEPALERKYLDQWGAISNNAQVIKHQYLKDYWVKAKLLNSDHVHDGIYKFTIDYFDGGFAEDPLQHKTSNIIFLDGGLIAALPNNYCIFKDRHFTNENPTTKYKRSETYHTLD